MANPRRNSYSNSTQSLESPFQLQIQTQSFSSFSSQWVPDPGRDEDSKANLFRFKSGLPSPILKDKRGWLLNPVSLALHLGLKGGALSCASVHLGEIQPGGVRGNHRHYTCNETFVIWGAKTKFRVENIQIVNRGYAEVSLGEDEVAVAASPSGTAHALINVDPLHTTYFMGCQDTPVNPNSSNTDFNVWKDL
ncbi:RmlC-like jelly roll [Corchorus capsularis]|uniref:RmlC-like jelly roll n=1 Tax=Corchorus capsularis TaxID=210143 RepID=A0A1R3I4S0_COCAP|nr:RmlC-like jelly roll [Corchorus capsularis]